MLTEGETATRTSACVWARVIVGGQFPEMEAEVGGHANLRGRVAQGAQKGEEEAYATSG